MTTRAPLTEDDHYAKRDEEVECVEAERRYAIERHEQLQRYYDAPSDFDPAVCPQAPPPGGDATTTRGGRSSAPSEGHPSLAGGVRGDRPPWLVRAADIFCRPMRRPQASPGGTDPHDPCTASSSEATPVDRTGVAEERRDVGTCGSCMGPLMFDPIVRCAACPCGDTAYPRAFFTAAGNWRGA